MNAFRREIEIEASIQAGSHALLLDRTVEESRLEPEPVLFHRAAGAGGDPMERASR